MDFNQKPLKIFFSYYKPHLHLFIADMICAFLIAIIDLCFPMLSRYMLNNLIPEKAFRTFILLTAALFIGYLIRWVCNWFVTYWGHDFGSRVETDMRRDVFYHLEKQSFSFFDANRTGKLMSRATTDLFEITELAHHGPEDFSIAVLSLLGSFFLLLKIRWELAIIVLISFPVILFITIFSRRKLSQTSITVKEKTSEINADLESSISGIRVTQSFANEKYEISRFAHSNNEYRLAKKSRFKYMASFMANIDLCNNLLNLLVLFVGGYFIMQRKMSLPDLIAANLFVASFTQPIKKLVNFVEQFATGMAGFNRFIELMRTDTQIQDSENAIVIGEKEHPVHGNLKFDNVSFSYNPQNLILDEINLEIKAGQKFALVGASGGGKSTICNLIPRFYEANSGQIRLDNIDIKNIKLESLRKQIGIVQQDVFLFAGSIKENIAYGKPDATEEEIIQAAKQAEIHEDILKMPQTYNTLVGERGIKLSGGQKQRISIARCFLKNPPILILDEATSALDTATEIKIQTAFDKLSKGRTSIVIAHRLSTIINADCIAVINDKKILECGTHKELMEKKGEYFKLQAIQNSMDMQDAILYNQSKFIK